LVHEAVDSFVLKSIFSDLTSPIVPLSPLTRPHFMIFPGRYITELPPSYLCGESTAAQVPVLRLSTWLTIGSSWDAAAKTRPSGTRYKCGNSESRRLAVGASVPLDVLDQ
jgi:hypothetical protein